MKRQGAIIPNTVVTDHTTFMASYSITKKDSPTQSDALRRLADQLRADAAEIKKEADRLVEAGE